MHFLCMLHTVYVYTADEFKDYLISLYSNLKLTRMSGDTGPYSFTDKVFNLAMIKTTTVRMDQIPEKYVHKRMTGKVNDILQDKERIQLKDIFQRTKEERKVVLLEGAPGCGKCTLSAYIAQQCQNGKLFDGFDYIVLVQLWNHVIQPPESITALLPGRNNDIKQKAASKIRDNDGQGVLFILDGWDELPSSLRNYSIFRKIIQPPDLSQENLLFKSAVIVTSRPIALCDLQRIVSARIEILGFTPEQLNDYFTKCLSSDHIADLMYRIDEIPAMVGSCYLPLNACILVNVFMGLNYSLPTTQYKIFERFILSCINRDQKRCIQQETLSIKPLDSLDNLPSSVKESLCKLTYEGMEAEKYVFSHEEVCGYEPHKLNLLGFLQGVQSLASACCEQTSYHSFICSYKSF